MHLSIQRGNCFKVDDDRVLHSRSLQARGIKSAHHRRSPATAPPTAGRVNTIAFSRTTAFLCKPAIRRLRDRTPPAAEHQNLRFGNSLPIQMNEGGRPLTVTPREENAVRAANDTNIIDPNLASEASQ